MDNGGNQGREGSCALGEIVRRFLLEIWKEAKNTDTLVRTKAVISGH